MRVEVRIENNDRVSRRQVDADTACPSAQDIDENIGVRLVELVHALLTVSLLGIAVLPHGIS